MPIPGQAHTSDTPIVYDVNPPLVDKSSFIPLCLMINCRSLANKRNNLTEMMNQISPDLILASETWERENLRLDDILKSRTYKSFSYFRKSKSPGGGCAIIYNETRFKVFQPDIFVPEGVEAIWAVIVPKAGLNQNLKIKRIAICSIYVSPRSKFKKETIDHIIESVHVLRAQYDNDISFLCGGDFNKLDISDVLESYGGLKQIVSISTRKSSTLSLVLTDLHSFFHPPTSLPPLQVDADMNGKDGDHNIVLLAPKSIGQYSIEKTTRTIKSRPILDSQLIKFEQDLANFPWDEYFEGKSPDEQSSFFHQFLRSHLDYYFPEKITKITNLDRKWMSPNLKSLHRKMQREFFAHRKSVKYKKLKTKFKKMKKLAIRNFYSEFVSEMKLADPSKWYGLAKKIGAVDQMSSGNTEIESLQGLSNAECASLIAEHFAAISNQYHPVDYSKLPSYLPAQRPPKVTEHEVWLRLKRIKKTKSTLPLDIPDKLRQECALFLAKPLHTIINTSLMQSVYPEVWKLEWITPAPKVLYPKEISDLRKISSTSDYSKVFEGFLKDWIIEDVYDNLDIGQYGGLPGTGTEHMIVCLIDRVLKLLDRHHDRSAVIMTCLDWSAAFDRQDPTLAIKKFIKLGVRPSLIPLLASYLTNRKMQVKFNGELSQFLALIGGGPQGTLLGQLEYIVQSDDNTAMVPSEDRFKYIDDLSLLYLVLLSGILIDYDFNHHVASDIAIDEKYLPPESFSTQSTLNSVASWTQDNLMKINEKKSNYMVFSRSQEKFATRLHMNGVLLEKVPATKLLGVWVTEDLSWSRNCSEICKKAYSRLTMLTKLKYVGTKTEDLIDIYILYIRSLVEYCSVAFHSSLTQEQEQKLERIQKTCLRVILGEMYISYEAALEMSGLKTLKQRREIRCLKFSTKCLNHPKNQRIFPRNDRRFGQNLHTREAFEVNWARTQKYKQSAIPYCQRLLNDHFKNRNL